MADLSVKLPKPKYGQVVVLQKNGDEPRGHGFPLISTSCVVGRSTAADIRISSADVSLTHCKFLIDEASGEASLEVHGNETEVNGTLIEAVATIQLNHRDVVLVGGRKLRFEYLPPDYKPLPSKPIFVASSDSFNAEVVDLEENGDVDDISTEKEEEVIAEVQCTPASKRVSFGPYLSPEQFDNTLPPATPIKKGATPRRSTRYSGLKFTRPSIDHIVEEEIVSEVPAEEQSVSNIKECVDETIISEDADTSNLVSADESAIVDRSPSLGIGSEFADLPIASNLEMSIDAMSTMSDVSNIAAVPSECCSFLDEPIEEDEFGPEVVEQEDESLAPMGDACLFSDDLMAVEIPVPAMTPHLTNGTELIRSFTTSSLTENIDEDEEGITLSPEDMSPEKKGSDSTDQSTTASALEEVTQAPVAMETKDIPSDVKLTETDDLPKNVEPVVDQLAEGSTKAVAQVIDTAPAVVVERVEQIDIEKVLETPESSPAKASSPVTESPDLAKDSGPATPFPQTPEMASLKLDATDLEGVARLLETPKTRRSSAAARGRTPQADYTDVRGVKKLMQTPKPPPNTPKADYRDVRGVKRLLATPKPVAGTPIADYADVEGIEQLMKTPKVQVAQEDQVTEAAPQTPKTDNSDVEGIDLLMKTPKHDVSFTSEDEKHLPATDAGERTEESTAEVTLEAAPLIRVPDEEIKESENEATSFKTSNNTKADDSNNDGVQRLLETPKAATETPKADHTDVECVDLLMKTHINKDALLSEEAEVMDVGVSESLIGIVAEGSAETVGEAVTVDVALALDEENQTIQEDMKESGKDVASPRRTAAHTSNTPKADYRDVSGVKRLLKTPEGLKSDYTDMEGVDLLMQTPKAKDREIPVRVDDKDEVVCQVMSDEIVEKSTSDAVELESSATEEMVKLADESTQVVPPVDQVQQPTLEEPEIEKGAPTPRRGRRAAATAKTPNTPLVDNRDVAGVELQFKMRETAKTDRSDMERVDLPMKTPQADDAEPVSDERVEVAAEESTRDDETTQPVQKEGLVVVAQTDQPPIQEESVALGPALRRGRKIAVKTSTPKSELGAVKRSLKTTRVASSPADHPTFAEIDPTIAECDDQVKVVALQASLVEPAALKTNSSTEDVDESQPDVEEPEKVEKEVTPPRRGRRAASAPKTNTPKPTGRSKRKQSESDSQPESNGSGEHPSDQVESSDQGAKVDSPKRSRRDAAPSIKGDAPKSVRSTRGQRPSESDSGQSDQVENRRSKRRKEHEKLTLSPVVRLQRIDLTLGANPVEEVASKTGSSSGEEWSTTKEVNPVRRGRGRPPKVPKTIDEDKASIRTAGRKGKAIPAAEESIPSDDEDLQSTKKTTTRRGGVKRLSIPEEVVPVGKRRRGETARPKHVTGLDDVEMLHEGKGHAADIHANHMPEEPQTDQVSPATSTQSGRSTRSKSTLKVHFDVAESAASPARATRSARKATTASSAEQQVAVVLERDHDIDTLAATVTDEEDKVSAKRSRQKKVAMAPADESPAVPAAKRTRGGKKSTSETLIDDSSTLAPPSPRRSRRTRNN